MNKALSERKRVCVLFGVSPEHEVSLSTATSILKNIDRSLFEVLPVAISKEGKWFLYNGEVSNIIDGTWINSDKLYPAISPSRGDGLLVRYGEELIKERIDCAFPALHGETVKMVLYRVSAELQAYRVGAMVAASAVSMDKTLTKAIVKELGIRQARYEICSRNDLLSGFDSISSRVESSLGYRYL